MLTYVVLYVDWFQMDNYRDSVVVDLNNIHYTYSYDVEYSCDEDVNDVVSSEHQSSNNEDDSSNDDIEESEQQSGQIAKQLGDRLVSINFIISYEICVMESEL